MLRPITKENIMNYEQDTKSNCEAGTACRETEYSFEYGCLRNKLEEMSNLTEKLSDGLCKALRDKEPTPEDQCNLGTRADSTSQIAQEIHEASGIVDRNIDSIRDLLNRLEV